MNKKLMAGGVAYGNGPGTGIRGAISKFKKVPAVESVNSFLARAKNGWTPRKSAVLFSIAILCVGAGSMVGCGTDNPLSGGSEVSQSQNLTKKNVVYLNASGELTVKRVHADYGGDTLMLVEAEGLPTGDKIEIQRSEVLGVGEGPPTREGVTFAKGNYLDSYGDEFADVEYLLGKLAGGFRSLTDGEIVVVQASVSHGITFSGKEVQVKDNGNKIKLLIYADEYWLNGF